MSTCCVTFGQRYHRERHPVDGRAHPDGWFEYVADDYATARAAARRHLGDAWACDYDEHDIQRQPWYALGCLARFVVGPDGALHETPTTGVHA